MLLKPNTLSVIKVALWLTLLTLFAFASAPLMAETIDTRTSTSISFNKNIALDKTTRDERLKQANSDIMASLNKQGFRRESTLQDVNLTSSVAYHAGDFSIYDASTELISDANFDGHFHRFSIEIDVDTFYASAYVYAKLYLSYEGGPWNHYATSDYYHIYDDSERDRFVIETELADGFPTGYYDVRIEIYDADLGEWLLSYGPYDDHSLSALPLQDAYLDDIFTSSGPIETEVVVVAHGHGAMSGWLLFIPALITIVRYFNRQTKRKVF